ncbi:MAG: ABC transporter permease [Chloroflexota bacterium]|nr:ABC transporter permease [Chloroflexota bacterium]MDE2687136.1 ABC transporter permease [Chloroflexota bacterium]MYC06810.1 ABC transporter permease [Chloroflexota bacterium]
MNEQQVGADSPEFKIEGGRISKAYQSFRRWPFIPVAIAVSLVVVAVFAELVAPHDPLEGDTYDRNEPPVWAEEGSPDFLLGTDHIGRDILSRMIFGARVSLIVAVTVLIAGAALGTLVGLVAGYMGGLVDEALMRLVDFVFALPFIVVALVASVVWGASLELVIILLSLFTWAPFARQVRAESLQLKTMDYVALARVAGASGFRITVRHILPGVVNTVMVLSSLQVGSLILTESVLSFLGVGIPPPQPSWGSMVSEGRQYISTAWWISFFPGFAILLIVFSMNFFGDWLRDKLDPRLRQI